MADSGQTAFRPEGQITCVHHKGKTLELFCEKCQDVACTKCVTTVHKGHDMCDLCDITAGIIDDIREFVEDTERSRLPKRQENIRNTTDELQQNSDYFDNLSEKTKRQAEMMKKEIDIMTAERLSFYQQMKEDNERLLTYYRRELKRGDAELQDQLQECKRLLQNASAINIYNAKDQVKNYGLQQVAKPALQTTSFEPPESVRGYLEKAFGEKKTQGQKTNKASSNSCAFSNARSSVNTRQSLLKDNLLLDVNILGQRELEFCLASVCCHQTTKVACVCFPFIETAILHVFDTTLKKQKEIQTDNQTHHTCYARDTNNIWAADNVNNCIIEIISGSPTVKFYTKNAPNCLCVTLDLHVLVGMEGRVTKFSLHGDIILSSENVNSGKCSLFNISRIKECPVTQNIAIVDQEKDDHKSNKRLMVLNKHIQQLYCCSEVPAGLEQYTGTYFRPVDVVFDICGNIVVAEITNRCIILLDGEGNFVAIVYNTKIAPTAITVDSDNILWVATGNQIERIQYSRS